MDKRFGMGVAVVRSLSFHVLITCVVLSVIFCTGISQAQNTPATATPALSQNAPQSTTNSAVSQSTASEPSQSPPETQQPKSHTTATAPAPKTTELTDFQQLVAQSLGYPLPIYESLYDFLSRQLEAARIDEAKNAVLVQVVDRAVVPEKKSGPRRMLIVAVTAVLSFLLVSLFVLLREAIRRRRHDPFEAARLDRLNQYLRSPLG